MKDLSIQQTKLMLLVVFFPLIYLTTSFHKIPTLNHSFSVQSSPKLHS